MGGAGRRHPHAPTWPCICKGKNSAPLILYLRRIDARLLIEPRSSSACDSRPIFRLQTLKMSNGDHELQTLSFVLLDCVEYLRQMIFYGDRKRRQARVQISFFFVRRAFQHNEDVFFELVSCCLVKADLRFQKRLHRHDVQIHGCAESVKI